MGGAARRTPTPTIMLQPFLPRKQLDRCALGSSDVVVINIEQHECEKEGVGGRQRVVFSHNHAHSIVNSASRYSAKQNRTTR